MRIIIMPARITVVVYYSLASAVRGIVAWGSKLAARANAAVLEPGTGMLMFINDCLINKYGSKCFGFRQIQVRQYSE
jgi:hypothetical protein